MPVNAASQRMLCMFLVVCFFLVVPSGVHAFEIFGLKIFEPDVEETAEVEDPVFYGLNFSINGDDDLESALRDASLLVADEGKPVSGSLGLLVKVRDDRERLVAALYSLARYDGTVAITIAGQPLDEIPPNAEFSRSVPIPVIVTITAGDPYRFGEVAISGLPPDMELPDTGLKSGEFAGSDIILSAENSIVAALQKSGRPMAEISAREIVADHATRELDVSLAVHAGPSALFGTTSVTGSDSVDQQFAAEYANIEPGRLYSPEELKRARERLALLEVFDSVSLVPVEKLPPDGRYPVVFEVADRKHRYFGAGATYSTDEGGGIEGYWGHRNLFGRAEKLRIEASIARIGEASTFSELDYHGAVLFEKPGAFGPLTTFTAGIRAGQEITDAYDSQTASAGVGMVRELTAEQKFSAGVTLEWSRVEEDDIISRYLLVSVPLEYVIDRRSDRLNPVSGYRLLVSLDPAYDFLSGTSFVTIGGEASTYYAVDEEDRLVLAGRIAGGSILGAGLEAIPAYRRFYAGGGGSVRGYAYQSIGPKDAEGNPTGGRSLFEASLEARIAITDTLGLVPFVDLGTVSQDTSPDFSDIRVGVGVGIRYLTPIGPLRVDVGVPVDRRPGEDTFGIYAGVGQAF